MKTTCFLHRARLVAPAFLVALTSVGHAEVITGFSTEWLAHTSQLVAIGTPVAVETRKGLGDVWLTKVRYRLHEVLKGPLSPGDSVTIYDLSYAGADRLKLKAAARDDRKMLLFATIATEDKLPAPEGKYTLMHNYRSSAQAFFLDDPVKELFTSDFRAVTQVTQLIEQVRGQIEQERAFLKRHPCGRVEKESIKVPLGSEAHLELYAGSAVFLVRPTYLQED